MRVAIGIEGIEGIAEEEVKEGNDGAACEEDAEDSEDETNVAAPRSGRPWRDTGNTSAGADVGLRAIVVVPSAGAATSGCRGEAARGPSPGAPLEENAAVEYNVVTCASAA